MIKVQQPVVISAARGDTLCIGNTLQLSASGAEVYSWSPASGLNDPRSPTPIAKPTVSVVYTVTGKDVHNCFSDTANVPVVVYPYPLVDAGADHQIGAGGSITLHPAYSSDVQRIKWSPPSGLDCATCPFPIAKPKETTTYQVEVANEGGCIARDEMTVHVFCNNGNLYIPNTFSPNGDGPNDVFYPRGSGIFSVKTFRIFNRWGELIFERSDFQANDPSLGWTGRHKGKSAPQDVYVYTVEILCENRVVLNFKGNVVLIR
jgi:gliding motility-associated-like protein